MNDAFNFISIHNLKASKQKFLQNVTIFKVYDDRTGEAKSKLNKQFCS